MVLIEYVPYGDLLGYLRKSRGLNDTYYKDPDIKPQTSLTSEQLMKFAWQIADGMSYLSSRKVNESMPTSFHPLKETVGSLYCNNAFVSTLLNKAKSVQRVPLSVAERQLAIKSSPINGVAAMQLHEDGPAYTSHN